MLTDEAFPQGSVFTGVELREREKTQLETLARRVERGLSVDDYIGESGGLSQTADAKRIYVVRASGAVEADRRALWFQREVGGGIQPGDTVVVPLKVDQPLARWTQITQILYNLAIAATAVSRF